MPDGPRLDECVEGVLRLSKAEALLSGRVLDEDAIRGAAAAASGPSRPMDNTDFSVVWRKQMTRRFVAAALSDLA